MKWKHLVNKLFSKNDQDAALSLPKDVNANLTLKLKDLVVGYLSCKDGIWTFKYSDEFKEQQDYHRIIGFSELNKVYTSENLWPFFRIRIPGLKQPAIQEIINKEGIKLNEFDLLKRFGNNSISNPYELVSS